MQASTPPTEYVPGEQRISSVFALLAYFPAPAVVHDAAAAAEYFPLVQAGQVVTPPSEKDPPTQSEHALLVNAVQGDDAYFPAAQ